MDLDVWNGMESLGCLGVVFACFLFFFFNFIEV